jgi:trehalose 6-phosphate synthase/phosphatase
VQRARQDLHQTAAELRFEVDVAAPGSIVVTSNRLPVTVTRGSIKRSSGGLVSALDPALREMEGTWVGYPGAVRRLDCERLREELGYSIAPVFLSPAQVRGYYYGFSNRTLWPLFHSLVEHMKVDARDWGTYEAVNECFAAATAAAARRADLIWIHDYHLMRAGIHLRERLPEARLAFFLHIPFPPHDIYRILPWYGPLLHGLLACDLVGFHCPSHALNFIDCAERLLGAEVDRSRSLIRYAGRTVHVRAFPLGIDFEAFNERARSAAPATAAPDRRVILGVDRLDYTKGIPERIRAFEQLLTRHKQHRGKVSLVQLAVPSRSTLPEYAALKREIDELVGRVNGRFGTRNWTPVQYLYRSVNPSRLAAMYRDADVALVTPLRDGMNLVAKEYVACQVDDPGVLIVSRLAGVAEGLEEADALLVSPYNIDGIVSALHRALTMRKTERALRMARLQERERKNDVYHWLEDYLSAALNGPTTSDRPMAPGELDRCLGSFVRGREVALFLDFDGTLAPIVDHPGEATIPREIAEALTACAARADTSVTVVSGRALDDLRKRLGPLGVGLAGNHGLQIEAPGLECFEHPDVAHFERQTALLARALRKIEAPGAWVEEKGVTLTLHLRAVAPAAREQVVREARKRISGAGFQPRDALCAIEARPPIGWDKGLAVLHILRARYGPAWPREIAVICAGDDETDEDAFRALQDLGMTVRVGPSRGPSLSRCRLDGVPAVAGLLRWLADREARAS